MAENSKSKKQVVDPKNEDQVVFDTIEESLNIGEDGFAPVTFKSGMEDW